MITIKDAAKIAASYSGFPLHKTAIDAGDCWLFSFDSGFPPVPGELPVIVKKETGETEFGPTPASEPDIAKLKAFWAKFDAGTEVSI